MLRKVQGVYLINSLIWKCLVLSFLSFAWFAYCLTLIFIILSYFYVIPDSQIIEGYTYRLEEHVWDFYTFLKHLFMIFLGNWHCSCLFWTVRFHMFILTNPWLHFWCSLYQNVQHIMNSSSSKFGDFRKFIYIFKVCFGEEQKSCQNIKTVNPIFFKTEIQKFI